MRVTAHGATDAASRDDLIVDLADRRIARAADFPHQRTGRSAREGHRPLHAPSPRLHRPGPATRYLFLSHPSAASLGELSRIRLRHDHRARRPAELFSDTDSGAWRHARCLWQAVDRFRSRAQFGPQPGGTRKDELACELLAGAGAAGSGAHRAMSRQRAGTTPQRAGHVRARHGHAQSSRGVVVEHGGMSRNKRTSSQICRTPPRCCVSSNTCW